MPLLYDQGCVGDLDISCQIASQWPLFGLALTTIRYPFPLSPLVLLPVSLNGTWTVRVQDTTNSAQIINVNSRVARPCVGCRIFLPPWLPPSHPTGQSLETGWWQMRGGWVWWRHPGGLSPKSPRRVLYMRITGKYTLAHSPAAPPKTAASPPRTRGTPKTSRPENDHPWKRPCVVAVDFSEWDISKCGLQSIV